MADFMQEKDETLHRALLNCLRRCSIVEDRKAWLLLVETIAASKSQLPRRATFFFEPIQADMQGLIKQLEAEIQDVKMEEQVNSLGLDSPPEENLALLQNMDRMMSLPSLPDDSEEDDEGVIDLQAMLEEDDARQEEVFLQNSQELSQQSFNQIFVLDEGQEKGDTDLDSSSHLKLKFSDSDTSNFGPIAPDPAPPLPTENATSTFEICETLEQDAVSRAPGTRTPVTRTPGVSSPVVCVSPNLASPVVGTAPPAPLTMVRPRGVLPPQNTLSSDQIMGPPLPKSRGFPPSHNPQIQAMTPIPFTKKLPLPLPKSKSASDLGLEPRPPKTKSTSVSSIPKAISDYETQALPKENGHMTTPSRQSSADSTTRSTNRTSSGEEEWVSVKNHDTHRGSTVYRSKRVSHPQLMAFLEDTSLKAQLTELGTVYLISSCEDPNFYTISLSGETCKLF